MRYERCHGEYNENLHHEMRWRNETKNTIFRYDINIMRLNGGKTKKRGKIEKKRHKIDRERDETEEIDRRKLE